MPKEITEECVRAGSVACGGAAAWIATFSEWTTALLGVPLPVALAAIGAIGLVVSYQDRMGQVRLFFTVLGSLLVACACAVGAIATLGWPKGAAAMVAAAVGIVLQVLVPWLLRRGPELLDRLAARLPFIGKGEGNGDQSNR